jgi:23S rRNA (uracil1939-C5)-methyltransferase
MRSDASRFSACAFGTILSLPTVVFRAAPSLTAAVMDTVVISALDQEGRGVARIDGKAVFVEGALIGERVAIEVYRNKPNYALARMIGLVEASHERVAPPCPHFGVCGGCSLQHLEPLAQVAVKQRVLEDALWHIARVRPQQLLSPIYGPAWGYRQRARLSVRYVPKKGGVLVGFHEKKSSFVADMTTCPVLPPKISALLPKLRILVGALSIRDQLPQIELAIGDGVGGEALILRHLAPLTTDDEQEVSTFAQRHDVHVYLQAAGPASIRPFFPAQSTLSYSLPDFAVKFEFGPSDFTQVNAAMNRMLVRRAIGLLSPEPGDRIADFFCGLGNFTLPIARQGAAVIGVEGSAALVQRAELNAAQNTLTERARFVVGNLFEASAESVAALGPLDKALIDPPREGAIALVKALPPSISRVVYVSCNAATLARDAAALTGVQGFVLRAAGIANMFPHTAHVESVALFER